MIYQVILIFCYACMQWCVRIGSALRHNSGLRTLSLDNYRFKFDGYGNS